MAPFERAMVVSYRPSILTIGLSLPFGHNLPSNGCDVQINRGVTLGQSLGRKELTDYKPNFNTITGGDMEMLCAKVIVSISSAI